MGISGAQTALMRAQVGPMRFGATRIGYQTGEVFVVLNGVLIANGLPTGTSGGVRVESLSIEDQLDDQPNTCRFQTWKVVPVKGQDVVVTIGSINNMQRLFAGTVLTVEQVYESAPDNILFNVDCIDYTWRLGRKLVAKKYTAMSADAIARDLMASYAPSGFTVTNVQSNLLVLDEITFTNEALPTALARLAARAGCYWYLDYFKDLHFFTSEDGAGTQPLALTATHPSLTDVVKREDLSQVITRVLVEGYGLTALAPVSPGDTLLPVDGDGTIYYGFNAQVVSGPQRISYSGVYLGGAGTLVGPGVTPSSAPAVVGGAGAGIDSGAHTYAYTWQTASGETLPSPLAPSITLGALANPTLAPVVVENHVAASDESASAGSWGVGVTVEWGYAYEVGTSISGATTPLSPTATIFTTAAAGWYHSPGASPWAQTVRVYCSPDSKVNVIVLWHRTNGGTWYRTQAPQITNNPAGSYIDVFVTGSDQMTAEAPAVSALAYNQSSLSNIAIGPSGTTARKVYRTAAGAGQLKLLTTIANNTATTYADTTADSSLGANAPTGDTSGLAQPSGQVMPAATTILVAGPGAFAVAGGWAVIGNGVQVVRYTGISGNSLTGIPASGVGSITAAVAYNSTITQAASLAGIPASGVGSILYAIKQGDEVNILVTVNDGGAQTALAALLGGTEDGIQEEYVQDRRLSNAECNARARAILALRSAAEVTVTYKCRDLLTKAGRTIVVNLPAPTNISATLKLQHVTIGDFQSGNPTVYPTFTATASSSRFSLDDLLRMIRGN